MMYPGLRIFINAAGIQQVEDTAASLPEPFRGFGLRIEVGELGTIRKHVDSDLYECSFLSGTILVNEKMVDRIEDPEWPFIDYEEAGRMAYAQGEEIRFTAPETGTRFIAEVTGNSYRIQKENQP